MKNKYIEIPLEDFINREYPKEANSINKNDNFVKECPSNDNSIKIENNPQDNPKYGKIDKSFINIMLFITCDYKAFGVYTDQTFIEKMILKTGEPDYIIRNPDLGLQNYLNSETLPIITGNTDSKLELVETYNATTPYIVGLNVSDDISTFFTGVLKLTEEYVEYVINGDVDSTGGYIQNSGIVYKTYFNETREVFDSTVSEFRDIPLTEFKYFPQEYTSENNDLYAMVKDERLKNYVEIPTIKNDVFIDRGDLSVEENHLRMSEISSVEQLVRYNRNFFNVQKF